MRHGQSHNDAGAEKADEDEGVRPSAKKEADGSTTRTPRCCASYVSDRGKIRARRVTGNCVQHQRDIAIAVKNAREVALLPFTFATGTLQRRK